MQQEILNELETIRDENDGVLRPRDVVAFATDPQTALHSQFDWSDASAAHKYRLHQARGVIRVAVTVMPTADHDVQVRAYVSLRDERKADGGYRAMIDVMSDAERRQRLLQDALSELDYFEQKYRLLSELSEVFSAARKVRRASKAKASNAHAPAPA